MNSILNRENVWAGGKGTKQGDGETMLSRIESNSKKNTFKRRDRNMNIEYKLI